MAKTKAKKTQTQSEPASSPPPAAVPKKQQAPASQGEKADGQQVTIHMVKVDLNLPTPVEMGKQLLNALELGEYERAFDMATSLSNVLHARECLERRRLAGLADAMTRR